MYKERYKEDRRCTQQVALIVFALFFDAVPRCQYNICIKKEGKKKRKIEGQREGKEEGKEERKEKGKEEFK